MLSPLPDNLKKEFNKKETSKLTLKYTAQYEELGLLGSYCFEKDKPKLRKNKANDLLIYFTSESPTSFLFYIFPPSQMKEIMNVC